MCSFFMNETHFPLVVKKQLTKLPENSRENLVCGWHNRARLVFDADMGHAVLLYDRR